LGLDILAFDREMLLHVLRIAFFETLGADA
jgi:hypothetical protein